MSGLNDINDIPKAWRAALASVQLAYPEAVIAGGALRDREQGVKVKDLDIFISTNETATAPIERRLRASGWPEVRMNGDASYGADANARNIVGIFDMPYPGAPDVQLIAMNQFRLEEIDFGICQIMFDGKTIHRTRDYQLDAAARQFRLVPKVDDRMFHRSLARWFRLKEKYPEWTLHLGSRAETDPFVPPARPATWPPVLPDSWKTGGVIDGGPRRAARMSDGTFKAYLDMSTSRDVGRMLAGPGDYVVPKALAERLARETTAQLLKTDGATQTCTIHVDDRAVIPSTKIIQEMLEARDRLNRRFAPKLDDPRA